MSKTTIVLIDRQLVLRRMLRFAMELQGYQTVEADDIDGVHAVLAASGRNLLVVGVYPGEDDVRALVDEIRRQPAYGSLPILLVGDKHLRTDWDLRAIGGCAWLDKPFRMRDLHAFVDSLFDNVAPPSRQLAPAASELRHV